MTFVRTQVYITPEHHAFLKEESQKRGVALTELLRCILDEYVHQARPKEDFMKIVAMGRSGRINVSKEHDKYIAEALNSEHVR